MQATFLLIYRLRVAPPLTRKTYPPSFTTQDGKQHPLLEFLTLRSPVTNNGRLYCISFLEAGESFETQDCRAMHDSSRAFSTSPEVTEIKVPSFYATCYYFPAMDFQQRLRVGRASKHLATNTQRNISSSKRPVAASILNGRFEFYF